MMCTGVRGSAEPGDRGLLGALGGSWGLLGALGGGLRRAAAAAAARTFPDTKQQQQDQPDSRLRRIDGTA